MESNSKKIINIVGPTGTGKTSVALILAKEFDTEIVSADSRQIVKHLDIGTGKIPHQGAYDIEKADGFWLINDIKVWGYDVFEINEYFSAFDFAKFSRKKLNSILEKKDTVAVAGGTGYYIQALYDNNSLGDVAPDFDLRAQLEGMSLQQLQYTYTDFLSNVDQNNKVRVIRAIEKALGEKAARQITELKHKAEINTIGLTQDRERLYSRADKWVDSIWAAGIEQETKWLLENSSPDNRLINGLIYKSVTSYLNNNLSREDAIQECKYAMHAYIRRQLTWFKKRENISWIDITNKSAKDITLEVKKMLKSL